MGHNHKVLTSSSKHDWQTPESFLCCVRQIKDIALDPCSTDKNPTKAVRFITEKDNGLTRDWKYYLAGPRRYPFGLVFVNPPYGRAVADWARKVRQEADEGVEIVLLVPARTDTLWWQETYLKARACLLWRGRIHFVDPNRITTKTEAAPFPVSVFYFGPHRGLFVSAMSHRGVMI